MTEEQQPHLTRLAQLLQSSQVAGNDPLRRLAEALIPDESYSHEQAEHELPDYVSDELLGRPVARLYPALHRHLLQCETCAEIHANMLAAFEETPPPFAIPKPKLDFLPAIDWRKELVIMVQRIRDRLWPEVKEPVNAIAEMFFAQVDQGSDVRLSRGGILIPSFAFGGGDAPITLRVLAATYIANQTLIGRYGSLDQAAASLLVARPEIATLVETAAKEASIAKKDRQSFVETFLTLLPGQDNGVSLP